MNKTNPPTTPGPPARDVKECAEIAAAEYQHRATSKSDIIGAGAEAAANILCAINGLREPWHPKPAAPAPDNEDAQEILAARLSGPYPATLTDAQTLKALADPNKRDPVGELAVELVDVIRRQIYSDTPPATVQETAAWDNLEILERVEEVIRRYNAEFNFKP